ncbi:MAG: DNA polymerase III subunit delta [Sphaerochaetaceae bacterium]|jgi:DNA polymerase-3 subunit delta|nr:DNA polymerase III subunit delta [Sphaerochaetaceae bacterium]MDD3163758.1 DNA polymerase III subunit delta [Sphaerochaetaceae bacterium]MDD4007202.1 DNA polymerase III subunit delta [Sphaerochaetaceae bacterium]MDD4397348.1 DNA polymerase III subunit delta [Sphaerochaetaceae bacterium]
MGKNYLLLGPETGEKNELIEKIKSELGPDAENYKFYPFDDFADHLADALSNASLFSPSRFIWLDIPAEYTNGASRPAFIKKDLAKMITDYLSAPDPDVTFVISIAETAINKEIDSFFSGTNADFVKQTFWEMKDSQKPGWVKAFFYKNRIRIEDEAVSRILLMVDNDTAELKTICSQLSIFFQMKGSSLITDDDIETYLTHTRQDDGYTLFSYIAEGNLQASLECGDSILRTAKDQLVSVFASLVWSFRRLHSVLVQTESGTDQYAAFQNASVLDRKMRIARPNDVTTYKQACNYYKASDTERIISALAIKEIEFRSGGQDLQRIQLHKLIYDIVVNKGRCTQVLDFPSY